MKRFLISALLGCLFTGLLFAICQIPTNGPTPITIFIVVPFQIAASLITKQRALGEIVYYGIQIIAFGFVGYLALSLFSSFKQDDTRK
jgi:hypothetical protein